MRQKIQFRIRMTTGFVVAALWLLSTVAGWAEQTNAPTRNDENSFRVISDRNIFNPHRYARSSGRTRSESTRPASRVDSFTLVGLMAYEKGVFAFFDGTNPSYRKTLEGDGAISEFKIAGLTPEQVKLVAGTNEFTLRVGMQVRREDEGDWFLTEPGQTSRGRVVISRGRSRNAQSGATNGVGTEEGVFQAGMDTEPEIIVVEPEPADNNGTPENGEVAPNTDSQNDGNPVTDPTLLRLMQRRQQLNQ